MRETLRGLETDRLERSCGVVTNAIRFGAHAPGIDRAEAWLSETAFAPHRHDAYAIGVTTAGVQTFRYRGRRRTCLPGQLHILHPDELHDGAAATPAGLRYRIVYLAPELIRCALDGGELPFVADPVQPRSPAADRLARLVWDVDEPIDELRRTEIAVTVAECLQTLGGRRRPSASVDLRAVTLVREHLAAHASEQTPAAELEQIAGLDRFTIARQFRRAFGTSPDRYRTLRRLELARSALERGLPLAQAAARAGFADQSHLTRQFKRTYGMTPGRWRAAVASGARQGGGSRVNG